MSIPIRILLIVVSFISVLYVLRKIRKSQLQIEDSLFWIVFSAGIAILSIFPIVAVEISEIIGVESPANLIFLVFIFILLLKVFIMSIKISQLEHKLKILVQEITVRNINEKHNKKDNIK